MGIGTAIEEYQTNIDDVDINYTATIDYEYAKPSPNCTTSDWDAQGCDDVFVTCVSFDDSVVEVLEFAGWDRQGIYKALVKNAEYQFRKKYGTL